MHLLLPFRSQRRLQEKEMIIVVRWDWDTDEDIKKRLREYTRDLKWRWTQFVWGLCVVIFELYVAVYIFHNWKSMH